MRHLLNITDLTVDEVDGILKLADEITAHPDDYREAMRYKKLATLFFEPSTRTRLSFEAAMLELGGSVLGFSSADASSTAKGETVTDTVRTVGCYADIIAMRHPKEGAPMAAVQVTTVPIINAGDGGHNHPTQTLTDLLTIRREKGRLSNMTIGLCGDLKFGRTVHSLIAAMAQYEGISFVLISPQELRVPQYIERLMREKGCRFSEAERMEDVIDQLDILYMTRVQRERFFNEADYIRLRDSYILTPEKLIPARKDLSILHPLPRVTEISHKVDADPRASYFRQVLCGKQVRKALIMFLLDPKQRGEA
ncbi:MAG: aspartate carbamoyltransferase [Clostridia bacterium]|nr:aspartate carbamoyltransferase [Clostridia bacterium]